MKKIITKYSLLIFLLLISVIGVSDPDCTYGVSYSKTNALKYADFNIQGTSWLSFRDIPDIITKHVKGTKTLDLGCGSGRSTRFLKSLKLNVIGTDISSNFIEEAIKKDKENHYLLMLEDDKIPAVDNSYDLVFSSFVLLMIPTKEKLCALCREVNRILNKDGIFIVVTGSEDMHLYHRKWVSYETNFPENKDPKSGSLVKVQIKDVGAMFYDYNWTHVDYLGVFKYTGFDVIQTHFPLGKDDEGYEWLSETECSPYAIYVLRKR